MPHTFYMMHAFRPGGPARSQPGVSVFREPPESCADVDKPREGAAENLFRPSQGSLQRIPLPGVRKKRCPVTRFILISHRLCNPALLVALLTPG